jgi:hypothetical protein
MARFEAKSEIKKPAPAPSPLRPELAPFAARTDAPVGATCRCHSYGLRAPIAVLLPMCRMSGLPYFSQAAAIQTRDCGALFISRNDGASWQILDRGAPLKTTAFALAVDHNRPSHVFCSSKIGQVFRSLDRGGHWRMNPSPGRRRPRLRARRRLTASLHHCRSAEDGEPI